MDFRVLESGKLSTNVNHLLLAFLVRALERDQATITLCFFLGRWTSPRPPNTSCLKVFYKMFIGIWYMFRGSKYILSQQLFEWMPGRERTPKPTFTFSVFFSPKKQQQTRGFWSSSQLASP